MKNLNIKYFSNRLFLLVALTACSFYASAQKKAKTAAPAKTATTKTIPAKTATTAAAATTQPEAIKTSSGKSALSIIDVFFKKYKTSSDSAIDYLFSTNPLFTNMSQINVLKSKLDSLTFGLGKYVGKELIAQKSGTNSLVIYSYLVKHQNQPIRFIFMFYKAQNDWELYRFNYDDAMDVELMEAVKINNKKSQ